MIVPPRPRSGSPVMGKDIKSFAAGDAIPEWGPAGLASLETPPTLESVLARQFGQPCFSAHAGSEAWSIGTWSREKQKVDALEHLQHWLLRKSDDESAPRTAAPTVSTRRLECLVRSYEHPASAVLVLASLWDQTTATFRTPAILVLGAPRLAPPADKITVSSIWSDSARPSMWDTNMPPSTVFAGSVSHQSRPTSAAGLAGRSLTDLHDGTLFSLEGERAFGSGWFVSNHVFPTSPPADFQFEMPDSIPSDLDFLGPEEEPPRSWTGAHKAWWLPRMFPLPFRHGLPLGQFFHPRIGWTNFLQALQDWPKDDADAIEDVLGWTADLPLLQAWFDAVAAAPEKFIVQMVPRSALISALDDKQPGVDAEGLDPF